ncbi:MAG: hypothetical protein R3B96_13580 [Pirellulaceae bacterium]
MDARTYRVKNLSEALELIRRELGPDAALLHTRRVRRASIGGWLGATELEVTASARHELPSRLDAELIAGWDGLDDDVDEPTVAPTVEQLAAKVDNSQIDSHNSPLVPREQGLPDHDAEPVVSSARPFLAYQRNADLLGPTGATNAPGQDAQTATPAAESSYAASTTRDSHEHATRHESPSVPLSQTWSRAERLRYTGPLGWRPGRSHWVAIVGPTGVGKTTTLAKIAAEYRLEQQLEVGLVSLDTYRVNGAAHLRTYAEILQLPLEVVETPEQMQEVAASLTERFDIVLLDTGGQGPRDHEQRRQLKALLDVARPDEVLLSLSASASPAAWRDATDRFRCFDPTSLIVTKLDEAPTEPGLIETVDRTGLPLSYLTFGQQVPQDIALADPQSAHDWIVAPAMEPSVARVGEAA